MTITMITVLVRPCVYNYLNSGGNVASFNCEVTMFAIIALGFNPALCIRRTSPLCRTLVEVWRTSACAKTRQKFARRKTTTSKRRLHFMWAPISEHSCMAVCGATDVPGEDRAELH